MQKLLRIYLVAAIPVLNLETGKILTHKEDNLTPVNWLKGRQDRTKNIGHKNSCITDTLQSVWVRMLALPWKQ
jgi:hypothetical protein